MAEGNVDAHSRVLRLAQAGHSLLVDGVPRSGKTQVLLDLAAEALSRPAPEGYWSPVLLLAPDRRRADLLDRELSQRISGRKQTLGPLGGFETHRLVRSTLSYAHLIVRLWNLERANPSPDAPFVSGAGEDVWVADYLGQNAERWKDFFEPAVLRSPAFRMQVRNVLARSGEAGLTPEDLEWLGRDLRKDLWVVAADVYREFAGPGDLPFKDRTHRMDAARLPRIAADLLSNWESLGPSVGVSSLRPVPALLLVDDAQDLPMSAGLLVATAGRAADQVVVVSSPTSASAVFRGGNPQQGLSIASQLDLEKVSLDQDLRSKPELRAVSKVVRGWAAPADPGPGKQTQRGPAVTSSLAATETSRTNMIAAYLRRKHLLESVPWDRMAVITRTASEIEPLRRQLARLEVPLQAADRPITLAEVPTCAALLQLLSLRTSPEGYEVEPGQEELQSAALDLVASPLVRADSLELFRLTRDLASILNRPLTVLELLELPDSDLDRALTSSARRKDTVHRVKVAASLWAEKDRAAGLLPEEGLWVLWVLADIQDTLVRQALNQDGDVPASVSLASQDALDAVIALFRRADLWTQKLGDAPGAQVTAAAFAADLLHQQVASDSLARTGTTEPGVQVLTASSAAGQSWQVVCVSGPQLGTWPAPGRDSLGATRSLQQVCDVAAEAGWEGETPIAPFLPRDLGALGSYKAQQDESREDEARLFNLAVTRAGESLHFAAVASADASPSVFLHALSDAGLVAPLEDSDGQPLFSPPAGPITLPELAASARAEASRAAGDQEAARDAVTLLALLASEGVAEADPRLWGVTGSVSTNSPVVEAGPLRLSPSRIQQAKDCPLQWFLSSTGFSDQDVGERPDLAAGSFIGTLVHEIAEENPHGTKAQLLDALQVKWDQWGFERETFWGRKLWDDLEDMMDSLALHFAQVPGEVTTEFAFTLPVGPAVISGRADRLETLDDGSVRVVDIKTGARSTLKLLPQNPQLLAYQLAVRNEGKRPGGAGLLELRRPKTNQLGKQDALGDAAAEQTTEEFTQLAEGLSGSTYPAVEGGACYYCEFKSVCPAQGQSARGTE